jgi:hypothetical protein
MALLAPITGKMGIASIRAGSSASDSSFLRSASAGYRSK